MMKITKMRTFLCTKNNFYDIDIFETHRSSCIKSAAIKSLQDTGEFLSWCTADFETEDFKEMADDILGDFEDYGWQIFDITDPENVEKIVQTNDLAND